MKRLFWSWAAVLWACNGEPSVPPPDGTAGRNTRGFEAPVVTNAESPVSYPHALYEGIVEGTVILRLYADETGKVVPESTRLAEGSGHPELDSAALAGVAGMLFAPARRNGSPVAIAFLQPVHFRHPDRPSSGDRQ